MSTSKAVTRILLLASTVSAQTASLSSFFNITAFPREQVSDVTKYLNAAAELSTDWQIHQYFQDQCITQQLYPSLFVQPAGFVRPFSPFDNFFFVGQAAVSAWAYDTGDGLLVIDSLDNSAEVDAILVPGLAQFGYTGADIKHLILTHEHIDHYGGAKHIQNSFGTTIYASAACWDALEALPANTTVQPPTRDQILGDGQVLIVGNVPFETILTPGHTLGTLSLIFPVYDHGTKHMAGLSGGTGNPATAELRSQKVRSQRKFGTAARLAGVDTLISNHQVADHALFHADLLQHRTATSSNPFVIGEDNFVKYMEINALCTQVYSARQGQDLSVI